MFNYEGIRSFAASRKAIVIAFLWGFFEATFFFIVPDVFFAFTALFIPLFGFTHGIVSIIGTMAGGVVMYNLACFYPETMNNFLVAIPGINEYMILEVNNNLRTDWLQALFHAPVSGTPYKIFAVQAAARGINFIQFILATFPSRMVRVFPIVLMASVVGKIFKKNIKKHYKFWVILYICLWLGFYAFYIWHLVHKYHK